MPEQGVIRIYSVSGALVRQLLWTAADLVHSAGSAPSGDLPYDLHTQGGGALASGLYLFTVSSGGKAVARGKFVVIR